MLMVSSSPFPKNILSFRDPMILSFRVQKGTLPSDERRISFSSPGKDALPSAPVKSISRPILNHLSRFLLRFTAPAWWLLSAMSSFQILGHKSLLIKSVCSDVRTLQIPISWPGRSEKKISLGCNPLIITPVLRIFNPGQPGSPFSTNDLRERWDLTSHPDAELAKPSLNTRA
jgi:hypothetical protein